MRFLKNKTFWEVVCQLAIFYSLIMYFAEIEWGKSENSREGWQFFLWSERIVAVFFTIEYIIRWFYAKDKWKYPFQPMAIVDLIAILPFYIGFMVDLRSLRLVRTLRILRLLKFYRYNKAMRSFAKSFSKVADELKMVGTIVFFFVILSSTVIYECERHAQPEAFDQYSDAVWWSIVTLTTVGYGDAYPITDLGRLVATVTVIFGLGIFGTFISLIGSSFMMAMQEEGTTTVPRAAYDKLKAHLQPEDEEEIGDGVIQKKVQEIIDEWFEKQEDPPYGKWQQ